MGVIFKGKVNHPYQNVAYSTVKQIVMLLFMIDLKKVIFEVTCQ